MPSVAVGIGDDAAVIDIPVGCQLIATTDAIIDGVDFIVGEHDLRDIGYKSIAVNLSDIAAMGGRPVAAVVSLGAPASTKNIAPTKYITRRLLRVPNISRAPL